MPYRHIRPALFAFDPERVHRLALRAARLANRLPAVRPPGTPFELMGLRFFNRVGLAAGFDKNGEAVEGLGRTGSSTTQIVPIAGEERSS